MFHSFLFPPNSKSIQEPNKDQNMQNFQKNQSPKLSKYLENEIIKLNFQKEQERRKSLQQQSQLIEEEIQNKLLLQQRINKKERDLFAGQKNSIFLGVQEIRPKNNFNKPLYHNNQYSSIDYQQNNHTNRDEASNRQRSTTINSSKNQKYLPFCIIEQEIPIEQQNNMIQCNQVLDFKISIDSQHSNYQQERKYRKQIPNYINFFQNRFDQPYKMAKEEFEKLLKSQNIFKQWGFIMIFIFRLIKLMRSKKIQQIQNLKNLKIRFESFNLQQIEELKLNWHEKLMQSVFETIKLSRFYSNFRQNQSPNHKQFIQNRKQWILKLSQLFFEKLVEMTKVENLNQEIFVQAQYHIFQINQKGSLFIAKRIKTKLNKKEQTLLICDYIFFSFIIEEIILNSNQLLCINELHLAECKFQLVSICSFIQILFMNYFKEMQLYQPKISKIIQKRLSIGKNKNQQLKIIEDEDIEENEYIIAGLNNQEFYEKLINENQKWYQDISTYFKNCVNNLSSLNNI